LLSGYGFSQYASGCCGKLLHILVTHVSGRDAQAAKNLELSNSSFSSPHSANTELPEPVIRLLPNAL